MDERLALVFKRVRWLGLAFCGAFGYAAHLSQLVEAEGPQVALVQRLRAEHLMEAFCPRLRYLALKNKPSIPQYLMDPPTWSAMAVSSWQGAQVAHRPFGCFSCCLDMPNYKVAAHGDRESWQTQTGLCAGKLPRTPCHPP